MYRYIRFILTLESHLGSLPPPQHQVVTHSEAERGSTPCAPDKLKCNKRNATTTENPEIFAPRSTSLPTISQKKSNCHLFPHQPMVSDKSHSPPTGRQNKCPISLSKPDLNPPTETAPTTDSCNSFHARTHLTLKNLLFNSVRHTGTDNLYE